jgi:hypothetical protein
MQRNMKINWLEYCQSVSASPKRFLNKLKKEYKLSKNLFLEEQIRELENNLEVKGGMKKLDDIYHLVIVTNYKESFEITKPTYDALKDSNYPNNRIIVAWNW